MAATADDDEGEDARFASSDDDADHGHGDGFAVQQNGTTPLIPPLNFSLVLPAVYRSGYPHKRNFPFIHSLRLRAVLCLCSESFPDMEDFLREQGIKSYRIELEGNREPFQAIPTERFAEALNVVLDTANHPILVHCSKGTHRTGVLMGVIRRMTGWSLVYNYCSADICLSCAAYRVLKFSSEFLFHFVFHVQAAIFDEYARFSRTRRRVADHQYIEQFDISPFLDARASSTM
jgi:tyrosine-protein phosphatase SIW14